MRIPFKIQCPRLWSLGSENSLRAAASALALLGLLSVAGACRASDPKPAELSDIASEAKIQESVSAIISRLIEAAKLRTDMREVRLCVHEIRPDPLQVKMAAPAFTSGSGPEWIGLELQKEIVVSLANRVNVVETELGGGKSFDLKNKSLQDSAQHFGVNHLLVGDYVTRGDTVILSVRLVDSESNLIIAAARGAIHIPGLSASNQKRGTRISSSALAAPALESSALVPLGSTQSASLASSSLPQTARLSSSLDFNTWWARRKAEHDAAQASQAAREARLAAAAKARAVAQAKVAEDSAAEVTAAEATQAETVSKSESEYPWRTQQLSKLLGVLSKDTPASPPPHE